MESSLQEGSEDFLKRAKMFTLLRTNGALMMIDKATEEFFQFNAPLGTLDALQAQAQEHMASVAKIPLVKLLGIQPAGLNASSEGELQTYEQNIHSYQEKFMRAPATRVIDFIQMSKFGEVDPDIGFGFEPLDEMDEKERAEIRKIDAETDAILVNDCNAITPEEVRARLANDEKSGYTDINPEEVPDPADLPGAGEEGGEGDGEGEMPVPVSRGASDAAFNEKDHPRGQPENSGQFGPGGGGKTKSGESEPPGQTHKGAPATAATGAQNQPKAASKTAEGGKSGAARAATSLYEKYADKSVTPDQIMERVGPGCKSAMEAANHRLSESVPTSASVADGGHMQEDGTYTPERQDLHRQIVGSILTAEAMQRATPAPGEKPVMYMLGGRGGSGKSWLTKGEGPVDATKAILIDTDHIKAQLPGFENWNAALYHEESTAILEMTGALAREQGLNVIYDATMKNTDGVATRMAQHLNSGYGVKGYYMFVPPQEAATRAAKRFYKNGAANGRYVPPKVVLANTDNEKSFDLVKDLMDDWAVYDNQGAAPQLVSKKGG